MSFLNFQKCLYFLSFIHISITFPLDLNPNVKKFNAWKSFIDHIITLYSTEVCHRNYVFKICFISYDYYVLSFKNSSI